MFCCSVRAGGERRCEVWTDESEPRREWNRCVLHLLYKEEGRAIMERKRVGRENVKWLLCFLTFSWNKYLHSIAEKEIDTKEKV